MIKLTIEIPCSDKLRKEVEKEASKCIGKGKPMSSALVKKLFKNKSIVPYAAPTSVDILSVASKIIK